MPNTSKSSKHTTHATATAKNTEIVDVFHRNPESVEQVAKLQKQTLTPLPSRPRNGSEPGAGIQLFARDPPAFVSTLRLRLCRPSSTPEERHRPGSGADQVGRRCYQVRAEAYAKIASGVSETIQKSVAALGGSAEEGPGLCRRAEQGRFEATKKQLGTAAGPATAVVDAFQRGTDAVIEAQKSVLNIASQPFVVATRTNDWPIHGEPVAKQAWSAGNKPVQQTRRAPNISARPPVSRGISWTWSGRTAQNTAAEDLFIKSADRSMSATVMKCVTVNPVARHLIDVLVVCTLFIEISR